VKTENYQYKIMVRKWCVCCKIWSSAFS